jgi:hypothetical protein
MECSVGVTAPWGPDGTVSRVGNGGKGGYTKFVGVKPFRVDPCADRGTE